MKYKALYSGVDFLKEQNLLSVLLKNRGVEDPNALLNLNESCVHDSLLLKNMNKGIQILNKWLNKAKKILVKIHVIVDEDCDGYTSASEIINYLKDIVKLEKLQVEITYTVHSKKIHEINLEELEGLKFDMLIVPDAGTNNVAECRELKGRNNELDILVLDHHNIEIENPYATVINCKDGQYPNNTLSGAGVVYKFIKEYDKVYGYDFADKYLDLFATGNIGDVMDLRNLETRYLTLKGIEQFTDNNAFLREIVEKQAFQMGERPNIMKIGWNVVPIINAVTRVGEPEERLQTFKAILGEEEYLEYKTRKSKNNPNPQIETQSLQKFMARECGNIKARQDRIGKKGMAELDEIIIDNHLHKDKVIIVDATGIIEKDFTGLIANKLASKYKRPIIVLKSKDDKTYGGSGRNYNLSPIDDLMVFLQSLNLFNFIGGHDNSFGFNIDKDKIDLLREKSNDALKDVAMDDVYKVDYEIPVGRLKTHHVMQVGEWSDLWGNKLNEPLFAITDIHTSLDNVKLLGEKKNLIKIETRDLVFIKKFANEDTYNRMIMRNSTGLNKKKKTSRLKFDFICKFTINEWAGNKTPQIEIVDFNVIEDSQVRF